MTVGLRGDGGCCIRALPRPRDDWREPGEVGLRGRPLLGVLVAELTDGDDGGGEGGGRSGGDGTGRAGGDGSGWACGIDGAAVAGAAQRKARGLAGTEGFLTRASLGVPPAEAPHAAHGAQRQSLHVEPHARSEKRVRGCEKA
eukprot:6191747-Pleurochrysis_carterae.AAC.4